MPGFQLSESVVLKWITTRKRLGHVSCVTSTWQLGRCMATGSSNKMFPSLPSGSSAPPPHTVATLNTFVRSNALARKLRLPPHPEAMAKALLVHANKLSALELLNALRICQKFQNTKTLPAMQKTQAQLVQVFADHWGAQATLEQLTSALRSSGAPDPNAGGVIEKIDALKRLLTNTLNRVSAQERNLEALATIAANGPLVPLIYSGAPVERLWTCIDTVLTELNVTKRKSAALNHRIDVLLKLMLAAAHPHCPPNSSVATTTLPLLLTLVRDYVNTVTNAGVPTARVAALVKTLGYTALHHPVIFRSCIDAAVIDAVLGFCRAHRTSFRRVSLYAILDGWLIWGAVFPKYADDPDYADFQLRLRPLLEDIVHYGISANAATLDSSHCSNLLRRRASFSHTLTTPDAVTGLLPFSLNVTPCHASSFQADSAAQVVNNRITDVWFQCMLCQRLTAIKKSENETPPLTCLQLAHDISFGLEFKGKAQRELFAVQFPSVLRALHLDSEAYDTLTVEECRQKFAFGLLVLQMVANLRLRPNHAILQRCIPTVRQLSLPDVPANTTALRCNNDSTVLSSTIVATTAQIAQLLDILAEFQLPDWVDRLALFPLLSGMRFDSVDDGITVLDAVGRFVATTNIPNTMSREFVQPTIDYVAGATNLSRHQKNQLFIHLPYFRQLHLSTETLCTLVDHTPADIAALTETTRALRFRKLDAVFENDVREWDHYIRSRFDLETTTPIHSGKTQEKEPLSRALSLLGPRQSIRPKNVLDGITEKNQHNWKRIMPRCFLHRLNAALEALGNAELLRLRRPSWTDVPSPPFAFDVYHVLVKATSWTQYEKLHKMMKQEPVLWTLLGDDDEVEQTVSGTYSKKTPCNATSAVVLLPLPREGFSYHALELCSLTNSCSVKTAEAAASGTIESVEAASYRVYCDFLQRHNVHLLNVYYHNVDDATTLPQLLYEKLYHLASGVASETSSSLPVQNYCTEEKS